MATPRSSPRKFSSLKTATPSKSSRRTPYSVYLPVPSQSGSSSSSHTTMPLSPVDDAQPSNGRNKETTEDTLVALGEGEEGYFTGVTADEATGFMQIVHTYAKPRKPVKQRSNAPGRAREGAMSPENVPAPKARSYGLSSMTPSKAPLSLRQRKQAPLDEKPQGEVGAAKLEKFWDQLLSHELSESSKEN